MITDERLAELIAFNERQRTSHAERNEIKAACFMDDFIGALRELKRRRELSGPMAPIAHVTVIEDATGELHVKRASLYAPGLPPGEHDLYPQPPQREAT